MDSSKQQLAVWPVSAAKKYAGFDGKAAAAAAARERSGLANASFRVYYSLRAGAVPFLWESSPGTPKAAAVSSPARESSSAARGALPPISPPPSYQSVEMKKGGRCRPRSSWPAAAAAGDIVRALLGMLGLGKWRRRRHHHHRSSSTRRRSASVSELPPFSSLPY
ncbi:hypothetical protein OsI_14064 [Oryza sativa Indica Group]|jgi:hypothetical protein|uniref:Uncharacterized protein n=1 Tax=Oryza sativa subsp. indica TaxID=39946 RepID=B8AMA0_ORYSI|nr:hypothetical protein OsI_14064 [Oryza sativa Indica Group]